MMLIISILLSLLNLVAGNDVAYIQIFDLMDQNKTSSMDPALVLDEELSADLYAKPEKYVYDLHEYDYMTSHEKKMINASNYEVSLQRLVANEVSYKHPLPNKLSLKAGENAAIFIDDDQMSGDPTQSLLRGTVCHYGKTPMPGLDEAAVILCPMDEPDRFPDLTLIEIIGSNSGCKGCKKDNALKTDKVEDALIFIVDDTNFNWDITIYYNKVQVCTDVWSFGDSGIYTLHLKLSENKTALESGVSYRCYLSVATAPSDFWLPIWLPILLLILFILLVVVLCLMNRAYPRVREEVLKKLGRWTPAEEEDEKKEEKPSTRLNSLDTFRGLAIAVMIFVNFGGGKYYFIEHSAWHGLGIADFVFPWFMFMIGVSIVLSVQSQLKCKVAKKDILQKVAIRFIKLFLIGVFLNSGVAPGGVELSAWRIPGVLQRIGFTYFICAVIEVLFIPRLTGEDSYGGERLSVPVEDNEYNECGKFINENPDVPDEKQNNWKFGQGAAGSEAPCSGKMLLYHTWPQWIIMAIFTALWGAITFAMPIPGCPTGYVGAGGIADGGLYPNCTGGAAGFIDRLIFRSNIYMTPTCQKMYQTIVTHDPEGLLGSLMAIITVYTGVLAGHIIVLNKSSKVAVLIRLLILALITGVIGAILCKGSLSGGWVPINKNLWTASYVMVTSSTTYALLALLYFLIDFQGLCCGSPFRSAGKNSILLYVGSYVLGHYFPFNWSTPETHAALMLQAIVGTSCWLLVGLYLDWKKIYYSL